MSESLRLREADESDALDMAHLIDIAGDGLPFYVWQKAAVDKPEKQSPLEIGIERAQRKSGAFSYLNTYVCEKNNAIVGAVIIYPIFRESSSGTHSGNPSIFDPLNKLEQQVIGSLYINALAVYEKHRNLGIGSLLLDFTEKLAKSGEFNTVSLIVADSNVSAIRLYQNRGYKVKASEKVIKENWQADGANWLLMTKNVSNYHKRIFSV